MLLRSKNGLRYADHFLQAEKEDIMVFILQCFTTHFFFFFLPRVTKRRKGVAEISPMCRLVLYSLVCQRAGE